MEQKKNTLKAIAPLQIAFTESMTEQRMELYVGMLSDINAGLLSNVVLQLLMTARKLPTIAEIREKAEQAMELVNGSTKLGADEAWGIVQKKIMSVGQYAKPHFTDAVLDETVNNLGWIEICQTPMVQTATLRAQFRKAYEQCLERSKTRKQWEKVGIIPMEKKKALDGTIGLLVGNKGMK